MGIRRTFDAVEVHEGEPMRVITGGVPYIPGNPLMEQRNWLIRHDDQIRKLMLTEPRGIPASVVSLLVPPKNPKASAAAIFMCGEEYPLCSGATVMATVTVLLETGLLPMQEPVTEFELEVPAGLMHIHAECKNGKVINTTFTNQPAFSVYLDAEVEVPTLGRVRTDVAWGGCFFTIIDAAQFPGLVLDSSHAKDIQRISALVTRAAQDQLPVSHPDFPGIGIANTMMIQKPVNPGTDHRTANVYYYDPVEFDRPETWTGAMDRGVCGTGSCAIMAMLHARGKLGVGEAWVNEGPLGIRFTGEILETAKVGDYEAVIPQLSGECWIYGYSKWVLDDSDPFPEGFKIGDIW